MGWTVSLTDMRKKYDIRLARFYYWKKHRLYSAQEIFENLAGNSMRIASWLRRGLKNPSF